MAVGTVEGVCANPVRDPIRLADGRVSCRLARGSVEGSVYNWAALSFLAVLRVQVSPWWRDAGENRVRNVDFDRPINETNKNCIE